MNALIYKTSKAKNLDNMQNNTETKTQKHAVETD